MTTREDALVRVARISDEDLDPAEVEAAVSGPEHGAVVVFTGKVRDHDEGQAVSALEYSAHRSGPSSCGRAAPNWPLPPGYRSRRSIASVR